MQIRSKFVVSVVSLLGAVACGDDDGGSGGTGGVSGSKKIGDLSAAEARSLCRSLSDKTAKLASASTEIACVAIGAAAGDEAACKESLPECREQFGAGEEIDCDAADDGDTGLSEGCDEITVSQFNDCLDATLDAFEDIKGMVSCSTDLEELEGVQSSYKTPAACQKIADQCPDLADVAVEF